MNCDGLLISAAMDDFDIAASNSNYGAWNGEIILNSVEPIAGEQFAPRQYFGVNGGERFK